MMLNSHFFFGSDGPVAVGHSPVCDKPWAARPVFVAVGVPMLGHILEVTTVDRGRDRFVGDEVSDTSHRTPLPVAVEATVPRTEGA